MQGAAGSGKSTMAAAIKDSHDQKREEALILGSDEFWNQNGKYVFDPTRLEDAHRWNQRRVAKAMIDITPIIIVDNTNTQQWEIEPYLHLAKMFGYAVQIVRVDPGLGQCLVRNHERPEDRRVPDGVLMAQYSRMEVLRPYVETPATKVEKTLITLTKGK
jgi:predicted kinase